MQQRGCRVRMCSSGRATAVNGRTPGVRQLGMRACPMITTRTRSKGQLLNALPQPCHSGCKRCHFNTAWPLKIAASNTLQIPPYASFV